MVDGVGIKGWFCITFEKLSGLSGLKGLVFGLTTLTGSDLGCEVVEGVEGLEGSCWSEKGDCCGDGDWEIKCCGEFDCV